MVDQIQTSKDTVPSQMPALETGHKTLMEGFSYRRIKTREPRSMLPWQARGRRCSSSMEIR